MPLQTLLIRTALLSLTLICPLPQLLHLPTNPNPSNAISPWSVLLNLIWTTQHFSLSLHTLLPEIITIPVSIFPSHLSSPIASFNSNPPTAENPATQATPEDYLNILQLGAPFFVTIPFFLLYLGRPPHDRKLGNNPGHGITISLIYSAFVLISLGSVILELCLPSDGDNPGGLRSGPYYTSRRIFISTITTIHSYVLTPVSTLCDMGAFLPQARSIIHHHHAVDALGARGLALQSLVSILVGLSWIGRLKLRWEVGWWGWYQVVGWAVVDNIIFGVVQGILLLLFISRKRWRGEGRKYRLDEDEDVSFLGGDGVAEALYEEDCSWYGGDVENGGDIR